MEFGDDQADISESLSKCQNSRSFDTMVDFIRTTNKKNFHGYPQVVMEYGIDLVSNHSAIKNAENFDILEEIFMVSLEVQMFDWSDLLLKMIDERIHKSPKSLRYLGMFKEASGNVTEAKNIY
jgi:hypothetical protein